MKNGDMPAIPFEEVRSRIHGSPDKWINHKGLTKREMIAMVAMQGLCAHSGDYHTFADMASDAVNYADALLAALERTA